MVGSQSRELRLAKGVATLIQAGQSHLAAGGFCSTAKILKPIWLLPCMQLGAGISTEPVNCCDVQLIRS